MNIAGDPPHGIAAGYGIKAFSVHGSVVADGLVRTPPAVMSPNGSGKKFGIYVGAEVHLTSGSANNNWIAGLDPASHRNVWSEFRHGLWLTPPQTVDLPELTMAVSHGLAARECKWQRRIKGRWLPSR